MSKPNPNRFMLVTSSIKLKSNNKLLQKSLELDIYRNDSKKRQVEEFLRLFYDEFINILVKEDKLVINLVRSHYLWFGLGGKMPDKKGAKKYLKALTQQIEFIRYLTRSSENESLIAPIVLGYAYKEGKFELKLNSDKGNEYLECASERGNEKATEILLL
ncbi:4492_t:CDS:2 [Scutellospora calospora]|uniref:4492_t:CDS:1 n=1 Tax=Scutellospora calospora TaxID=85575 RepID=A0ACA9KII9_9GLOM|nr:4492_t:CDS:2 [Scutellospora calospora]